jgi:hypothetical protein
LGFDARFGFAVAAGFGFADAVGFGSAVVTDLDAGCV